MTVCDEDAPARGPKPFRRRHCAMNWRSGRTSSLQVKYSFDAFLRASAQNPFAQSRLRTHPNAHMMRQT